jgi:cell division protein FtsN
VAQPQPEPVSAPVRVIEDRKEVKFEPAKVAKPAPKPAAKPAAKPQPKPAVKKTVPASVFSWYAQLGSYSTRALAEAGQRKLAASHASLFNGQKFVILAAQLKNGTTTYRLRVGFNSSADANSFCRNAKADGLECYVTK